jgi:uncharacterized membrane protein
MPTTRAEAFSDAVIAIIITIMVLELEVPHPEPGESDLDALLTVVSNILIYALSFVFLGIYWNNHHHLLVMTERITGKILWANLHLLFWLSLFPFMTKWMGERDFASLPTAAYGVVLLLAAIAYYILQTTIVREHGPDSRLAGALGRDLKGKISPLLYASAIPLAFVLSGIAVGIYVFVALMWLVPDRRIESNLDR